MAIEPNGYETFFKDGKRFFRYGENCWIWVKTSPNGSSFFMYEKDYDGREPMNDKEIIEYLIELHKTNYYQNNKDLLENTKISLKYVEPNEW